ncbi:MAG: dTDP-glucose 4,6-dehydratase [Pyrobaculum sp.]
MILVTGGAGFIGSALVHRLAARGEEVVVVDKLTYAGRVENLPPGAKLVPIDLVDFEQLSKVVRLYKPSLVFHLAAESHVDRSFHDPLAFTRTNVLGTHSLFEAVRRFADGARVVHVSTDEVYGPASDVPYREEDRLAPTSPYAASKAGGDMVARSYFHTYGLDVVVARPSNAYGPRQHPEKLIPKAIIRLMLGMYVPVHGSGRQRRTWTYVEDVVDALLLLAERGARGEAYNIASGEERSVLEVVEAVARALGVEPRVKFVKDRPAQDVRYLLDTSKISALGWRAKTPFDVGVVETVRWYRENRWWWEPLLDDEFFKRDEP